MRHEDRIRRVPLIGGDEEATTVLEAAGTAVVGGGRAVGGGAERSVAAVSAVLGVALGGGEDDAVDGGGGGNAAGQQKLMMGPWGHGNIDEVKYPSNSGSLLDMTEQQRWFDYWLKGVSNGVMDDPPIKYYVMGDVTDPKAPGNEWRTAQAWPVLRATMR